MDDILAWLFPFGENEYSAVLGYATLLGIFVWWLKTNTHAIKAKFITFQSFISKIFIIRVLTITVLFGLIYGAYWLFSIQSYEECILEKMPGTADRIAANRIAAACHKVYGR